MSQSSHRLHQSRQAVRSPLRLIGGLEIDDLEDAEVGKSLPVPDRQTTPGTRSAISIGTAPLIPATDQPPATGPTASARECALSDDERLDRVAAHLQKTGILAFQRLSVTVRQGEVVIAGAVSSSFEKQMLSKSLERLSGMRKWVDSVEIAEEAPEPRESMLAQLRAVASSRRVAGGIAAVVVAAAILILVPWSMNRSAVPTVSAKLHVNYEGIPAVGAFVTLHPVGVSQLPPNLRPSGYVQANGMVTFNTFRSQDGVPAGEYLATVQWNRLVEKDGESVPGPNIVPDRYGLPTTSGLRLHVEAGKKDLPALQLTR